MHTALARSEEVVAEGLPGPALARHMLVVDPPNHTRLRRLAMPAFGRRRVNALETRVRSIVEDLLADLAARGGTDQRPWHRSRHPRGRPGLGVVVQQRLTSSGCQRMAPEVLLESMNIVDDVGHCLKADASLHLVEQRTGSRDFRAGAVDDVLAGRVSAPADRVVVLSPFGLGVLELAVGKCVYDGVQRCGDLHVVPDFLHGLRRHG